MEINYAHIQNQLQETLTQKRYTHTLGVAYTSAALAMRYNAELMDKAFLCGILHDCAKALSLDEQVKDCQRYEIQLTDSELENPQLIHAKLGAYFAEHKYQVKDAEILEAIRWHTTGRPNMSELEKILYVADCIEPHRNKGDYLKICRELAFTDFDECLFQLLERGLAYLKTCYEKVDSATEETYQYYKKIRKQ